MRILLVEDDEPTARSLELMLKAEGYIVDITDHGEDGLEIGQLYDYDIILLDLMLPDMDGYEVLRRLRSARVRTPILILSGVAELDAKIKGLGFGADDYVTKPFSAREVAARVQVLLRRPRSPVESKSEDVTELGDLRIDMLAREVQVAGESIDLTKLEFDLLTTLAARPEMVFTRQILFEAVWGGEWYGDDHLVSVHIANLRKKIDRSGHQHIATVRGVGYRLTPS